MKIRVEIADVTATKTPALVVNLFQGVTEPQGATAAVDRALDGAISQLIEDGEIKGKLGEITMLHTFGRFPASRVVVAGLGKSDDFGPDEVRRVSGNVVRYLRQRGIISAATIAHGAGTHAGTRAGTHDREDGSRDGGGLNPETSAQAIAEGAWLGLYRFGNYRSDSYRPGEDSPEDFQELVVVERDVDRLPGLEEGVSRGCVIAEAACRARDMVNEPANTMTPTRMASVAAAVAESEGLEFSVLEESDMREMGMGAFLGVAQGSDEPAKLIVLKYHGDPADPANNLGLIGKGITFDTGGISLKPAGGMESMKGDMAGGASVIAAMQMIGRLMPKINVVGMVAATENMPGGGAQRPGDVVKAMNGKTIEIINTDAEGRLVLADTLCYAREQGVNRLVDVATLTGAMVTTLGKACTGVMGNDQQLVDQVLRAGQATGEKFWQLPMFDDYKDLIKSDVADMKNSGGRQAGSITAALLLGEFVGDAAWVHLDIAGTSTSDRARGHLVKGATGVPARTLARLALDLATP